ncbi:MAG: hypothetical protein J2P28_02510 [Actinobacteria bacterium]|nr:hypothetical protein [Actinomycetota bacterium]
MHPRIWVELAATGQDVGAHDRLIAATAITAGWAGYQFRELSPANPPHWFADGHIHMRLGG